MEWVLTESQKVANQIEKIIDGTQELYGSIYCKLPLIEEEIVLTTHEVEILLDFFLHSDSTVVEDGNEAVHLSLVLKNVFDEVALSSSNMADETEFLRIMDRFLAENNSSGISIGDLMRVIPIIKNKIADIELISMNAIIFSSKLGVDGRAFEVISDNIMALSNRVALEYDGIECYAKELEGWNIQFTSSLDEIINYHRRLTTEHLAHFQSMHTKVFESLKVIRDLLYGIITSIQTSVTPVHILMNLIQEQDIIQQSLENLVAIIRYVSDDQGLDCMEGYCEKEKVLNKLTFYQQVLALSSGLVGNIEDRLERSLNEIKETVYGAKNKLDDMLEEGGYLVEILSGQRDDQNNVIQHIFSDVDRFLIDFNKELEAMADETDGFTDTEGSFVEKMRGIEGKINSIKKSMDQLNRLNLLSRIELSRINNRDSSSFVSEITNISQVVIEEVKKNEEFIGRLRIQLEEDLTTFLGALSNNRGQVKSMQSTIESALSQMDMAKNLVIEAIRPIGLASKGLRDEIHTIEVKLEQGMVMFQWLKEVRENLQKVEQKVYMKLTDRLDEQGITNWDNQSPDFQQVLGHLTTHYERAVAKLSVDEDALDIGTDGNELTLF